MQVEWDADKARANLATHGVSFEDALTVFGDPLATTVLDLDHSIDEDRWLTTGRTEAGRLVVVSHTDREEAIRIISARVVTASERRTYELGE